ncbi:MAG: hypothetical protein E3J56_02250 [Candidatus Aminicenantes bacterium]|nr:MAG: hypothetical protein E3J56_02250 [Candidatus Aminicenantes bacterium]
MTGEQNDFAKNVFINCPFDTTFIPLLHPLIFTILYLGYSPKIATERSDSGEARINKIRELIEQSKLSIHDLSRIRSANKDEFYRMNMPFELGVDIGCRFFKEGRARDKKCLILEKEKYRYQKALSDMSGSDIKNHNNEPEELVRQVRNWFLENEIQHADSGTKIWQTFNEFMADFYQKRQDEGFKDRDLKMMPLPEYIRFIREWLKEKKRIKA